MKKLVLASFALAGLTTVANAAEPAFRIAHGGLRYQMQNSKAKADGGDTEAKYSRVQTMYGNWEIAVFHDGMAFYAEPAQTGGRVGFGLEVAPGIEVGARLGLTMENESESKDEYSSYNIEPYLTHTMDMGDMILESNVMVGYTMMHSKKTVSGTETKVDPSMLNIGLSTGPYWRVGKNFEIGAGLEFKYASSKDYDGVSDAATKGTDTTTTEFNVILQQWRYNF